MMNSLKIFFLKIINPITEQKVIHYLNSLKIYENYKTENSKYFKLNNITIRVSDHLQGKCDNCIGITVINNFATINVFNKVITTYKMSDIKKFLWYFDAFYSSKNLRDLVHTKSELAIKMLKLQSDNEQAQLRKTLNEEHKKAIKSLKKTHNSEKYKLETTIKNYEESTKIKEEKIKELKRTLEYYKKLPKPKNVPTKKEISNAMNLIMEISDNAGCLPMELQSKIFQYISDYS